MGNKLSINCTQVQSNSKNIIDENEKLSLSKFSFIWLHSSCIDSFSLDLLSTFDELRDDVSKTLKLFDDECECYGCIRQMTPSDKILLIIESGSLCDYLVPLTYRLCQVAAIFIYYVTDDNQEKSRFDYCKTKIKWVSLDKLVKCVKDFESRWFRYWGFNSLSINTFKQTNKKELSTCGIKGNFLFSQLLIDIFLQMEYQPTDMNEFIDLCAKEFSTNEKLSKDLHMFSNDYKPEESLLWYTKPIFLYSILNKALRMQDIELLYLLRFFIRDIYHELTKHQCQSSVKVFRGQLISSEEMETLKNSINDFISMNSFLSTSLDRQKAEFYLAGASVTASNGSNQNLIPVIFEIVADPNMNKSKRRPFANITDFSEFGQDEEEILFMIGSIYRVLDVYEENNNYVVLLQLSDNIEENMQLLMNYMTANKTTAIDNNRSLVRFINILYNMNKFDLVEKFAKRVLHETSIVAKYDSVNVIDIVECHLHLGYVADKHDRHIEALKEYKIALNHVLSMEKSYSKTKAVVYVAIAYNYNQRRQYKHALKYYRKALYILQEENDKNQHELGHLYTNMGMLYRARKKYEQSSFYHEQALEIRKRCLPEIHYDLAFTYRGLATVYLDLHEYDQALDSCKKALDIDSKSLPNDHSTLAVTYEYMAALYQQLDDIEDAKDYLAKASVIDHRTILIPDSRFSIITYTCPWCQHNVWIYKMFRFVKGTPCFRCLQKLIGIRRL